MQKEIENYLQKIILNDLENGRPGWDKPHTLLVVKKLKEILQNNPQLRVDETVLIIAAYAHDWGYAKIFHNKSKVNYREIIDAKEEHMRIGAEKLSNLLNEEIFNSLTKEQKERAIHLVRVHDKLKDLKDVDELLLMEADTLAALDVTKVTPTLSKEDNEIYQRKVKEKRLWRFITDYGKKEAEKLMLLRQNYYKS